MIPANLQTFTLLIVEDCPEDRQLYRRSLSGDSVYDYCLLEAESVAAGLELWQTQPIEIWESMTDAYITLDQDWRIGYANQAATQFMWQLADLTPAAFLGKSHWDLFPSLVDGDVERIYGWTAVEAIDHNA